MGTFWAIVAVLGAIGLIWANYQMKDWNVDSPNPRAAAQAQLVCPHCQTRGSVTARPAKRRRRLSATRILGAGVTLGASLPIVGTTKKNSVTEMHCSNCNMRWDVV